MHFLSYELRAIQNESLKIFDADRSADVSLLLYLCATREAIFAGSKLASDQLHPPSPTADDLFCFHTTMINLLHSLMSLECLVRITLNVLLGDLHSH